MSDCVFCDRSKLPEKIQEFTVMGRKVMVFEPLNPVVPGHLLVVPATHVEDATTFPEVAGYTMVVAADVAKRYPSANIITSIGEPATQSVMHLHLHVVPREAGDGLLLPWSIQQAAEAERARFPRVQVSAEDLGVVEPDPIDMFRRQAAAMEDASHLPEYWHEDGRRCSNWIYPVATIGRNGWMRWKPYAKGGEPYGWTRCEREHPTLPTGG